MGAAGVSYSIMQRARHKLHASASGVVRGKDLLAEPVSGTGQIRKAFLIGDLPIALNLTPGCLDLSPQISKLRGSLRQKLS